MSATYSKFILFSLQGETWALPLTKDSQFIHCEVLEPLPGVDRRIVGLTYNKGNLITVLHTAMILGLRKAAPQSSKLLVFNFADDYYALTVDDGGETIRVKEILTDYNKKMFKKYVRFNRRKIYILELEKIWRLLKLYV